MSRHIILESSLNVCTLITCDMKTKTHYISPIQPSKGINSNGSVAIATISKDEPVISEKYDSKSNYNPILSDRVHESARRQSLCDNLSSDTVTTREQEIQGELKLISYRFKYHLYRIKHIFKITYQTKLPGGLKANYGHND